MKALYLALTCLICLALGHDLPAQSRLFQPIGWEQANLTAARENKLVLVEVGGCAARTLAAVESDRGLVAVVSRQAVAVRMGEEEALSRNFKEKMQLYPWPSFAFFMPYGDLVGVASEAEVAGSPQVLGDILDRALEMAAVKRRNSRSVVFGRMPYSQALEAAVAAGRNLFVYLHDGMTQASVLMEKNVLNLDSVADFYNGHFLCIRLEGAPAAVLAREYGVTSMPSCLFLNAKGKPLLCLEGFAGKEKLLACGEQALRKAEGIPFGKYTLEEARELARKEGKGLFIDRHAGGSGHQDLLKKVFSDPEVADFFSEHFVNIGMEGEETSLEFQDGTGQELHRVAAVMTAEELLAEARKALADEGTGSMRRRFAQGERGRAFLETFIGALVRAGLKEEASSAGSVYFSSLPPQCLEEESCWSLHSCAVQEAAPAYMDYLLGNRERLYALYGKKEVDSRIAGLWTAGAVRFIEGDRFNEDGFRQYCRQLKKSRMPDSRLMVREARLKIAGQLGDWKTFVVLVEEKWNEGVISDIELHQAGMKVYENCRDGNVCYKMAQCLSARVRQMQKKEMLTGRIDIGSYKGFLEKLANDLFSRE